MDTGLFKSVEDGEVGAEANVGGRAGVDAPLSSIDGELLAVETSGTLAGEDEEVAAVVAEAAATDPRSQGLGGDTIGEEKREDDDENDEDSDGDEEETGQNPRESASSPWTKKTRTPHSGLLMTGPVRQAYLINAF